MGAGNGGEDQHCVCCGEIEKTIIVTEIRNQDWAKAVTDHNVVAVKFLHHSDPDLVEYAVDEVNGMAIHYAVTTIPNPGGPLRDHSMLEYLLENGAPVDAQGGTMYNTALHYVLTEIVNQNKAQKPMSNKEQIAAFNNSPRMEPLWECVRLLFSYGAKESLKNNDQKTALDIIMIGKKDEEDGELPKWLLTTYNRKKTAGSNALEERKGSSRSVAGKSFSFSASHTRKASDIWIGGMNLTHTHETTLKRYVKENDDATKQMKKLADAISKREIPETRFGLECGIDPDEIAVEMQKIPDLGKVWHKCTKGDHTMEVHKQTEIFKILYSLTVMSARKKSAKARRPPQESVRKLTIKVSKRLPKKKGRVVLEKKFFVEEFYQILYDVHKELKEKYDLEKLAMRR